MGFISKTICHNNTLNDVSSLKVASETWVSSVATKMVQSFVIVYSINMKRYDQECVG